jgi:hypothetical protein
MSKAIDAAATTAPLRIYKRRADWSSAHEHSHALASALDEFNSLLGLTLAGPDWTYHGFRSGAHIYSLPSSSSSGLPCCRGEAVIEGDWDLRDLVGTVRSFGARKVWDGASGALDDAQCGVAKWLGGTEGRDFLARITWKRSFPVGYATS